MTSIEDIETQLNFINTQLCQYTYSLGDTNNEQHSNFVEFKNKIKKMTEDELFNICLDTERLHEKFMKIRKIKRNEYITLTFKGEHTYLQCVILELSLKFLSLDLTYFLQHHSNKIKDKMEYVEQILCKDVSSIVGDYLYLFKV